MPHLLRIAEAASGDAGALAAAVLCNLRRERENLGIERAAVTRGVEMECLPTSEPASLQQHSNHTSHITRNMFVS